MPRIVAFALVVGLLTGQLEGSSFRPITVEDCVRTRRIVSGEVRLSPDGSKVAYVVKAPNLTTDANDCLLYVRDLRVTDTRENGRMVLRADRISRVRWVGSGELMLLGEIDSPGKETSSSRLYIVNLANGAVETPEIPGGITDYSASADGESIDDWSGKGDDCA